MVVAICGRCGANVAREKKHDCKKRKKAPLYVRHNIKNAKKKVRRRVKHYKEDGWDIPSGGKRAGERFMRKEEFVKEEQLIRRLDGRIERICEHGVGHTISVPKRFEKEKAWWSHGCDGCCMKHEKSNSS